MKAQQSHHAGSSTVSMLTAVVIAVFLLTFVMQPERVPSGSMERTLLPGDFVLVNRQVFGPSGHWAWLLPYRAPVRGDVVIFHQPPHMRADGTLLVKRVIALPGDRVRLEHGGTVLNGVAQTERFAVFTPATANRFRDGFPNLQNADPDVDAHWWIALRAAMRDGALPVPTDRMFVLGDNRNNSQDSRYWGLVPRENVVGEPLLVYFSVNERSSNDGAGNRLLARLRHTVRWRRTLTVVE